MKLASRVNYVNEGKETLGRVIGVRSWGFGAISVKQYLREE